MGIERWVEEATRVSCSRSFISSDILQKCLHPMLLKKTCLWHPSAWLSARLWLARARLSLSPSLLAPPSPSPWTPRSLHLCQRRRRSPVLQLWGEMLKEEKNSWKGRLNLLQGWTFQIQSNAHQLSPTPLCHFLQWKLRWNPSSVTNVMKDFHQIMDWIVTQKQHTELPQILLNAHTVAKLSFQNKIWSFTMSTRMPRGCLQIFHSPPIHTSISFLKAGASDIIIYFVITMHQCGYCKSLHLLKNQIWLLRWINNWLIDWNKDSYWICWVFWSGIFWR